MYIIWATYVIPHATVTGMFIVWATLTHLISCILMQLLTNSFNISLYGWGKAHQARGGHHYTCCTWLAILSRFTPNKERLQSRFLVIQKWPLDRFTNHRTLDCILTMIIHSSGHGAHGSDSLNKNNQRQWISGLSQATKSESQTSNQGSLLTGIK